MFNLLRVVITSPAVIIGYIAYNKDDAYKVPRSYLILIVIFFHKLPNYTNIFFYHLLYHHECLITHNYETFNLTVIN